MLLLMLYDSFSILQIGYMVFLVLFCYVILERLKQTPTWAEVYVMAFMITMGIEKIRQVGSFYIAHPLMFCLFVFV